MRIRIDEQDWRNRGERRGHGGIWPVKLDRTGKVGNKNHQGGGDSFQNLIAEAADDGFCFCNWPTFLQWFMPSCVNFYMKLPYFHPVTKWSIFNEFLAAAFALSRGVIPG